ncbi:MAG: hypothetical protein ACO36I_19315, partial [Candidatus Latescibacterota bacterium]
DIGMVDKNTTSFEDISAQTDIEYTYRIFAFDADDNQSESTPVVTGVRGKITPPASVLATDGQHPDKVVITWVDQDTSEVGYRIFRTRATVENGGFSTNATPWDVGPDVELYEDVSATLGVTYTYGVQTLGANGAVSIAVADMGRRSALASPIDVRATDGDFDDRIEIAWQDTADTEDGFVIYRDGVEIDRVNKNSTTYTDQEAVPGVAHTYSVSAYTNFGSESVMRSNTGQRSVVLATESVNATDGDFEDRVVITWESNATAAVMYNVYRDGKRIHTAAQNAREAIDFDIVAGVEYQYEVRSAAASGQESGGKKDKGRRELAVPQSVNATDEEFEDRVVVTWEDGSDNSDAFRVDGFRVYRKERSGNDKLILVGEVGRTAVTFNDRVGTPGQRYVYVVRAFEGDGESTNDENSEDGHDVGRRDLKAPTKIEATDGEFEKQVLVTWEDNSLIEDGYRIYRDNNGDGNFSGDEIVGETKKNKRVFEHTFNNFNVNRNEAIAYKVVAIQSVQDAMDVFKTQGGIIQSINMEFWESSLGGKDEGFTKFLAPSSFVASDTYLDKILLTWVDRSDIEDGYVVERKKQGGDWKEIASLPPDTESYEDKDSSLER